MGTGTSTPKHIQEQRYRERQAPNSTEEVCDHSDLVINEEEEVIECVCGLTKPLEPEDQEIEVNKPSMKRARLREVMRELEEKGEIR